MLIPIIKKNLEADDFSCLDGEIDFLCQIKEGDFHPYSSEELTNSKEGAPPSPARLQLTPEGTYPTCNLRIPLEPGDAEKAVLLLNGEISRVAPADAERITALILQRSAAELLAISTDLRRQGLFILPFRAFTMTMTADGSLSFPTPRAVALPTDYPPHPEITASAVTSDALTLSLRFPVRPHRLSAVLPDGTPASRYVRTYISYPLYIPDPKEMKGTIGSVRSIDGSNATGIRFAFLSLSAIKASVAAPEKYYEIAGNRNTGYRISSKAAAEPDYSVYAGAYGCTPPFTKGAMIAAGAGVDPDTDPLDWIADWDKSTDGYLPVSLPDIYRQTADGSSEEEPFSFPEGIDKEMLLQLADRLQMNSMLITRPMTLAKESRSRRNAKPVAVNRLHVEGLSNDDCMAILYGSPDCRRWHQLRLFNPHAQALLASPPRLWHRLLLMSRSPITTPIALSIF